MSSYAEPHLDVVEKVVVAVVLGSDLVTPIHKCIEAGTVTKCEWIPTAAFVGADTNTRTISVINKGAAGAGTNQLANQLLNAASGTQAADVAFVIPAGTGPNTVAAGDILVFSSVHNGTGLADPGGMVRLEITKIAAT